MAKRTIKQVWRQSRFERRGLEGCFDLEPLWRKLPRGPWRGMVFAALYL
jgi:hypothetical protein